MARKIIGLCGRKPEKAECNTKNSISLNPSLLTNIQKYLQLDAKKMIEARRMVPFSRAA